MFQDIAAGDRDREVVPEERVQAEGDRRADGEVPGPGGQDGAGEQLQHLQLLLRPLQVKSFEGEKRKLEQKIEKLTKQISVLEKAVEDNRDVAQTKEKAINETKQSMIQVTEEIGIYEHRLAGYESQELPGHVSEGGVRVHPEMSGPAGG